MPHLVVNAYRAVEATRLAAAKARARDERTDADWELVLAAERARLAPFLATLATGSPEYKASRAALDAKYGKVAPARFIDLTDASGAVTVDLTDSPYANATA